MLQKEAAEVMSYYVCSLSQLNCGSKPYKKMLKFKMQVIGISYWTL